MRDQYKYILDKSSKKFKCPNCGKKTFVKFIDAETLNYLSEAVGRCDRESKCGFFHQPNSNLIIQPKVAYKTIGCNRSYHNEKDLVSHSNNYRQNNFVAYLLNNFAPIDVKQIIKKYFLGTTTLWNGATIFWQVDEVMRVRAGKIMLYNCNTGSRIKKPYNHISWMHKKMKLDNFVLQQCLFGLHNLCDYKEGDTICVVESEKTAIIMSILNPAYLWLATGSKANFKEELLRPLKNFNIIAYPDKSEYKIWKLKAQELMVMGYNIVCSDLLEDKNIEEGDDLVDFIS